LDIVAEVAKQSRDDALLRVITKRQRASVKKRAASSTSAGQELRLAAERDRAEERERRAARLALEHQASLDDAEAKRSLEVAKSEAAIARQKAIEATRLLRQEEDARRIATATTLQDARWLQTEYPAQLARTLLNWREGLNAEQVTSLTAYVRGIRDTTRCRRDTVVPGLWEPSPAFTFVIEHTQGVDGVRRPTRCGKPFEWVLFRNGWAAGSPHDAPRMLRRLLDAIVPEASTMLSERYRVLVILAHNDNIIEKAFVYAVILLSKWLGPGRFPEGVHAWPPAMPKA